MPSQIGYYLEEESGWSLREEELEKRLAEAKAHCEPRVLVVINPGNPTGQVLTRDNIAAVLRFAHRNSLLVLADEVYQHNIYTPDRHFHSFKRVLHDLGGNIATEVQLASTMSASKGFMGEYVFSKPSLLVSKSSFWEAKILSIMFHGSFILKYDYD